MYVYMRSTFWFCSASDSAEDTQDLQIVQDNQVIEDEPVEIDQDEPVSQELEVCCNQIALNF